MIERFFFIRTPGTHVGGATVRVVRENDTDDNVQVQVTHCSQKTGFCRVEGRAAVMRKPTITMPIGELPKKFTRVARRVLALSGYKAHHAQEDADQGHFSTGYGLYSRDWTHIIQTMQPRQHADVVRQVERVLHDEETGVRPAAVHFE